MARGQLTPLGAVTRGAAAGIAGTLAMDLFMWERYRRNGGGDDFPTYESSATVADYDGAPAPAQVGRRIVEGYLQTELPQSSARLMNNAVHVLTGVQWGVVHGIVAGSGGRRGPLGGVRTGLTAWLSSYALLAPAGLYEPPWKYPPKVLIDDLSAHLVFGLGTAAAFVVLAAGSG